MFSQNRRASRAQPVPPYGESPAVIGQLYRACESELSVIVTYLHHAILLEEALPSVAALLSSTAESEINHYKALCRLLRDLGAPFRLQTRIEGTLLPLGSDPQATATDCLSHFADGEKHTAHTYRETAENARSDMTRRLLTALANEEDGHNAALLSMRECILRS